MSCVLRTQPAGHQMGERETRGTPIPSPPLHGSWLRPRDGPLLPSSGSGPCSSAKVPPSLNARVSSHPSSCLFLSAFEPCSDLSRQMRRPRAEPRSSWRCFRAPVRLFPAKRLERALNVSHLRVLLPLLWPRRPHCALHPTASSRSSPPSTSQSSCHPDMLVLLCLPPLCPWSFLCPFCYPLAAPAASRILPLGDSTCSQAAAISSVLVPLTSPPLPTPTCAAASGHLHGDVLPAPQT